MILSLIDFYIKPCLYLVIYFNKYQILVDIVDKVIFGLTWQNWEKYSIELTLFDSNYVVSIKKVSDFIIENIICLSYVVRIFVPNLYKLDYNNDR